MSDNSIDLIRGAELEAEKILRDAALEALRIKNDAYAEANRIGKLAAEAANTTAEGAVHAAREACLKFSQTEEAKLQSELAALRAQAQSRKEKAIEDIVSSLV